MTQTVNLHPIDMPGKKYRGEDLDRYMVFCLLDTANPYKAVCDSYDALERKGLTVRRNLRRARISTIVGTLRSAGYRFPNQKAKWLREFGRNPIDLKRASREDLVAGIKGIHYKLASMFLRTTRGDRVAVLDVHIMRWLKEHGVKSDDYLEQEREFLRLAKEMGKDPTELDLAIWQERRVKRE